MHKQHPKPSLFLKSFPIARAKEYSHSAYNRFVTFSGKRYSRLQTFSRKSNDEINEIISSMTNICNSMLKCGTNNIQAERQIHSSAINASSRLQKSIKLNQNIIREFNIEDHNDKFLSYEHLKDFKHPKTKSTKQMHPISKQVSTITTSPSIEDEIIMHNEHDLQLNKVCDKKISEMNKLQKLKGEILMMEQKKKYGVNKTYEHRKTYDNSYFLREVPSKQTISHKYIQSKYQKSNNVYSNKNVNYNDDNASTITTMNYYTVTPSHSSLLLSKRLSKKNKKPINVSTNNTGSVSNGLTSGSSVNDKQICYNGSTVQLKTNHSNKSNLCIKSKPPLQISSPLHTISNSLYKHKSYSNINTCNTYENNIFHKKKKSPIPKAFIHTIQNLHVNAYEQNAKLMKSIQKEEKCFQRCKSIQNEDCKGLSDNEVDVNKINKEFGFDPKKIVNYDEIDEIEIIKKNGNKLKRLLDKQGKKLLRNIVNRIIYNYGQINNKYYLDSPYERKLLYIKMKKDFQKVCEETIAIEKSMGDEIIPKDEKEVIKKMITKMINIENNSYQNILDLKQKVKVMKDVKPLIHEKKFKIKKKEN